MTNKFCRKSRKIFSETQKMSMKKSLEKSMKNENFEISIFFENFAKFRNFHFSLTFPKIISSIFFGLGKYFFVFRSFFSIKFFFRRKNSRPHIPIKKIPKIPKITLINLCDEAWSSIQHLVLISPQIVTKPC